jgi:Flp pilus assembly protein TadG
MNAQRRFKTVARRVSRRVGSQRGAAAVEFAIVVPLLFLLIFGIIDFGFGFHAWDASENAAREGARVAAVDPNTADILARVRNSSNFLNQSKLSVAITCSTNNGSSFGACAPATSWLEGDIIRVTVTYAYAYITPLPHMIGLGSTLNETAISESRFEGQ